jgi:hypothetical protein
MTIFEQQNCGDYPSHIIEAAHRVKMHAVQWRQSPRVRCSKCLRLADVHGECRNCNIIRIMVGA